MRYTALDFETGNAYYTSACAVGLSVFEDHQLVQEQSFLIRPPESIGPFHWYNVKIHGIYRSQLVHERTFGQLWDVLRPLIEGSVLVCHNASFDTSVLCKCLEFYGLPFPQCEYICTVKVAQRMWPQLPNHKLDTVSQALGISLNHHEAGSDARACGLILQRAMQESQVPDVYALVKRLGITMGAISSGAKRACCFSGRKKET